MNIFFLILFIFSIIIYGYKENYTSYTHPCSTKCFSSQQDEPEIARLTPLTPYKGKSVPSDVYGCCECKSMYPHIYQLNKKNINKNFDQCMCLYGYNDFCYNTSVNYLLPQY